MGFRMRKSFKVMPGVRMTVSPSGFSMSAGNKGGRVTVNSRGRVTQIARVPGTGVSYTSSKMIGAGRAQSSARRPVSPPPAIAPASPKPGMLAPRWEKDLVRLIQAGSASAEDMQRIGAEPTAARLAATFELLLVALPAKDWERSRALLRWLHGQGFRPEADPFVRKYTPAASLGLIVVPGISAQLPLSYDAFGLLLAEVEQDAGDLDAAIAVVEALEPTTIAAVSLAELYAQQGRWEEVVSMTSGIGNEDDLSTFLLTQRGVAFRAQGYYEASRESFKEALRSRSRAAELRQVAYIERGRTYLAEGKKSMARKDFERVLAENSKFEGLSDLLQQVS